MRGARERWMAPPLEEERWIKPSANPAMKRKQMTAMPSTRFVPFPRFHLYKLSLFDCFDLILIQHNLRRWRERDPGGNRSKRSLVFGSVVISSQKPSSLRFSLQSTEVRNYLLMEVKLSFFFFGVVPNKSNRFGL